MRFEQSPPKCHGPSSENLGCRVCGLRGGEHQGEHPNKRQCFRDWQRKGSLKEGAARQKGWTKQMQCQGGRRGNTAGLANGLDRGGLTAELVRAGKPGCTAIRRSTQSGEVGRDTYTPSKWDNKGGKEIQKLLGRDSV